MSSEQGNVLEEFAKQHFQNVLELLCATPAQAHLTDEGQMTLLHHAALVGTEDIVDHLMRLRVDVNLRDNTGRTALHWAANYGHVGILEMLLENSADLEIKDLEGMTPLMWGSISRSGKRDEVVDFLLRHGAKLDLDTALYLGKVEDAKRLLSQFGAQAITNATFSNDLLCDAVRHHSLELVELLLVHGADANALSRTKSTPLFAACHDRGIPREIVEMLLDRGANPNGFIPLDQRSPIELARNNRRHDIVDLLCRYGAKV